MDAKETKDANRIDIQRKANHKKVIKKIKQKKKDGESEILQALTEVMCTHFDFWRMRKLLGVDQVVFGKNDLTTSAWFLLQIYSYKKYI